MDVFWNDPFNWSDIKQTTICIFYQNIK
jgi:hypothetical protein